MSAIQRYISSELIHFVGRQLPSPEEQYHLLIEVIKSGKLKSSPKNDIFKGSVIIQLPNPISQGKAITLYGVCFCDIPIDDIDIHVNKYSGFGLSFLKTFLINKGANPVFYIARDGKLLRSEKNRGVFFEDMLQAFFRLLVKDIMPTEKAKKALDEENRERIDLVIFMIQYIFGYFKFFDSNTPENDENNYYMEREWRTVGDLEFNLQNVNRILLPRKYARQLREDIPDYSGQITFTDED